VREEALIRAMRGEEWPFQASFPSGPAQTEQQFHARTDFEPGRTDPAGMAPGAGHSGKTERALRGGASQLGMVPTPATSWLQK
jgi:hypothetical protein